VRARYLRGFAAAQVSAERADYPAAMAFDKFKNFWNVDIKNGVEGKAFVQSASMPTESATATNVSMWLDVYVDGWAPYRVHHNCVVKMSKHPSPGDTLPVVVDRENKERIDIQWDQVKTVDEIMREGSPGEVSGGMTIVGQPQVIDLRGAGLSGDLNERIQQAMQIAEQTMQQAQEGGMPGVTPPGETPAPHPPAAQPPAAPLPAAPIPAQPAASAAGEVNMVQERLAQLERLASLRDSGALSDEEFEVEKAKVLGGG
jgi:hypothetical protein